MRIPSLRRPLLLGVTLLAAVPRLASAAESVHVFTSDAQRLQSRRIWVELGTMNDFGFRMKGLSAQGGYFITRLLTLDARISVGSASYGAIEAKVDPTTEELHGASYPSATEPDSELNRPRDRDDSWKMTLIEPGIGMRSKMFVDWLPLLSEHVRFGVARASMTDETHGISFSGWIPSFEAGFDYQLGRSSPWAAGASLDYHWGHIVSSERPDNAGLLPVKWLGFNLSARYSF